MPRDDVHGEGDGPRFAPGSTRARGQAFEDVAVDHLRATGHRIEARNVVAGGVELDVVARARPDDDRNETYVFVEVRARTRTDRGHPFETIDAAKRRRLVRGATAWLVAAQLWERVQVRFDVIAVVVEDGETRVEHLEDAFWADA